MKIVYSEYHKILSLLINLHCLNIQEIFIESFTILIGLTNCNTFFAWYLHYWSIIICWEIEVKFNEIYIKEIKFKTNSMMNRWFNRFRASWCFPGTECSGRNKNISHIHVQRYSKSLWRILLTYFHYWNFILWKNWLNKLKIKRIV